MSKNESPHHQAIAEWSAAFEARWGSKYIFTVPDAAAVKRFLATGMAGSDLVANAKRAWDMPKTRDTWNCTYQSSTIHAFVAAYPKIVVELSRHADNAVDYSKGFKT